MVNLFHVSLRLNLNTHFALCSILIQIHMNDPADRAGSE
jgi:hypothetical protein